MLQFHIPDSAKTLIGLFIGLILGSVLSIQVDLVEQFATSFIMLLQMTALPYISLSLITSIGNLTKQSAAQLIKLSLLIIFCLSAIVILVIFISPIAFPNWENAEFYNASTFQVNESTSILSLFIHGNPFYAFANNLVPAVVLFSILLGTGLMQLPSRRSTIFVLSNLQQAVANINQLIMKIAPLGVLCIGYRASTSITLEQIDGLTVYLGTAALVTVLVSFLIIPALVATITPIGYRELLKAIRSPLITAFATGSFFAVIPLLVENIKALIQSTVSVHSKGDKLTEIIVPITFSLPVGGKLLAFLYVLFASWFSGAYAGIEEYISLLSYGLPHLFGSTAVAITHLLELFNVSANMYDMFILAENLVGSRLAAVLSISFSAAIPVLLTCANNKTLTFKKQYFARNALLIPIGLTICLLLLKFSFVQLAHQYQGYDKFIDRDFITKTPITRVIKGPEQNNISDTFSSNTFENIQQRGILRVGYYRDDLPFAFHNKQGKLVGFDVEILNNLALDLNVDIEFVRIYHHQAKELLDTGYLDITTGLPLIPDNLLKFSLTTPYSEQTLAFLVKDKRRSQFTQWSTIKANDSLIIGVPETYYYSKAIEQHFTQATAWEVSTPRLYFKEEYQHIDALLFGAAAASSWTLLYPEYTVVSPKPKIDPISMAFPIRTNDHQFAQYLANWIAMKKQSGFLDKLFTYWIEGKPVPHE